MNPSYNTDKELQFSLSKNHLDLSKPFKSVERGAFSLYAYNPVGTRISKDEYYLDNEDLFVIQNPTPSKKVFLKEIQEKIIYDFNLKNRLPLMAHLGNGDTLRTLASIVGRVSRIVLLNNGNMGVSVKFNKNMCGSVWNLVEQVKLGNIICVFHGVGSSYFNDSGYQIIEDNYKLEQVDFIVMPGKGI